MEKQRVILLREARTAWLQVYSAKARRKPRPKSQRRAQISKAPLQL
ncbi:hypothetical protein KIM372_08840 [Bombiscardovia nodaiensis]|uniref:Uncharacterized protein n=1 Tax=Bombiscardovia nodaiensis TaxID=2932181 RepID=A0ABN6SA04_9BIFI|nr:hypothetical protein KIM372_08840 [Bombiscardovia nodaiensis]